MYTPRKLWRKVAALTLATATTLAMLPAVHAQEPAIFDGSSAEKAAASCYEIKKNNSSAKSGSYWLYTPQMDAPGQFYCDQETDGGGWVMIGRGREGWTENDNGLGDPSELANNPDGTDAFTPVQLRSSTVDALLNGNAPANLKQGTRVRRALNKEGTKWQEFYATRESVQNWSWGLSAYAYWSDIKFDNPGVLYGIDRTWARSKDRIVGLNASYNSIFFVQRNEQKRLFGFSYGNFVRGEDNSTSYLYSFEKNPYALPFSQVFLKPQITQADLKWNGNLPVEGESERAQQALPQSTSARMKWRTSEATASGAKNEMHTYVQAISQVDSTVFVGGDYKFVQSSTGEQVQQSYLTGYNVDSADLIRGFTPTFNGQIKSLEGLPNGLLAVGGEFTEVNGEPHTGFVVLNATTGAVDHSRDWDVVNRGASGATYVKSMQVINGYLYIAGRFTHVKGATSDTYAYARNAARFKLDSGSVDWTWRPNFNGTVNGINAAEDGKAVFAAGYFTTLGEERAYKLASINPVDGTRLYPWEWKLSYNIPGDETGFQFDIQDAGNTVFTGGAEHIIAQYNKTDYSRLNSSITKSGGDFQDLSKSGNVIYGACHCGDWVYEGADMWQEVWEKYKNVYQMKLIAAFDAETGNVLPEFSPIMSGASGYGVWASYVDSRGVLWAGGDVNISVGEKGPQRTVGFVRYEPRDSEAPSSPSALQVATDQQTDSLRWAPSPEADVTYQIIRNNKVIGSTKETTFSTTHVDGALYFIRASDAAGNLSATTRGAVAVAGGLNDPETTEGSVIATGDQWQYKLGNMALDASWIERRTTVTNWSIGATSYGWGKATLATVIDTGAEKPLTLYSRKEFNLVNREGARLKLTFRADDGVAVYVNGQEVARKNLPEGALKHTTYATAAPAAEVAASQLQTVEVPVELLVEGMNVISAETHANFRSSPSVTFDLTAEILR